MYAVNSQPYHPIEPRWKGPKTLYTKGFPKNAKRWLLDHGSLTERLVSSDPNGFRVQILGQSWQRPRPSEQRLLDLAFHQLALIREVLLICHDRPWVFARSVLPADTLNGDLRYLRRLGGTPLGELLFRDPSMRRLPFEITEVNGNHPCLPELAHPDTNIWGRRCRFELRHRPLMVSEFFLPDFQP